MTREFIEKWINELKIYWLNKDIDKATSLFSKTTFYQETPFMKPYITYEEIKQEWQHIKEENIQEIKFNLLAIDHNTAIINWYLLQNNEEYDGIYEVKFNDNLECIYFKSWEMLNEDCISIEELSNKLYLCYSKELCYPKIVNNWHSNNKYFGMCAITALIVNDYFGGEICKIYVDGISHYFNLINNKIIDLTSKQFINKINYSNFEVVKREVILTENTKYRYELLKKKLEKLL